MAAHPSRLHTELSGSSTARPVAPALREFRCTGCGYGARCAVAPDRCPMCSGSGWDSVARAARSEWDPMPALARGH
jgi:rubredoxin